MEISERDKLIIDKYNTVYSTKKVADEFGLNVMKVYRILRKNNIDTRISSNKEQRYENHKHNYKRVNLDLFKNLDRHSCYLLGLLFADGTIYCTKNAMQLRLKLSDLDLLEAIRSKFFPNHSLVDACGLPQYKRAEVLIVCNNQICQNLIELGLKPRKTYSSVFPDIPTNLFSHFVRGFFDGNGSISFHIDKRNGRRSYEMVMISNDDFICKLLHKLNLLGFDAVYFHDKLHDSRIGKFRIRRIESIKKFYHFLYDNLNEEDIFLNRKYLKYKEFIEYYDNN